ncbi:MAG: hypothetical protein IT386_11550 [Deltaproteobacteria bacterium]|nr:hypothetical protein [Deltaproteobacteria bacterium]
MCSQKLVDSAALDEKSRFVYRCGSRECGAMMLGGDLYADVRCRCGASVHQINGVLADQFRMGRDELERLEIDNVRLRGELSNERARTDERLEKRAELEGELDECRQALGISRELPVAERVKALVADHAELLDCSRVALGPWIDRGAVPGAIPACIENVLAHVGHLESEVKRLDDALDTLQPQLDELVRERDELRTNNAALGVMAVESLGKASEIERELAAKAHELSTFAEVEAARDRAIRECERHEARARDFVVLSHQRDEQLTDLQRENRQLRSVAWAQTNATTALHDFVTELLEAQRLAGQVPSLFADEDEPQREPSFPNARASLYASGKPVTTNEASGPVEAQPAGA